MGHFALPGCHSADYPKVTKMWPGGVRRWDTCSTTPRSGRPAVSILCRDPLETWGPLRYWKLSIDLLFLLRRPLPLWKQHETTSAVESTILLGTISQHVVSGHVFVRCHIKRNPLTSDIMLGRLGGVLPHGGGFATFSSGYRFTIKTYGPKQSLTSMATCYTMDQSSLLEGTLIDPISPHAEKTLGFLNMLILNNCQPVPCCAEGEIGKDVHNKRHQTEHQPKPKYNPNIATTIS